MGHLSAACNRRSHMALVAMSARVMGSCRRACDRCAIAISERLARTLPTVVALGPSRGGTGPRRGVTICCLFFAEFF